MYTHARVTVTVTVTGAMESMTLSGMLNSIALGKARSLVRVAGWQDRNGIQQSLDLGSDGVLIPYVNNAAEVKAAVSCAYYPTKGTRSVYHPQPSNLEKGLLGYAGSTGTELTVAIQVETADCIKNIDSICATPGLDACFLGPNDLCLSMGCVLRISALFACVWVL